MADILCRFEAYDKLPCPAYADARSPFGFCFAHTEIYLHDAAITFRRKARKDEQSAERWALSLRLPLDKLKVLADSLPRSERPIVFEVQ